MDYHWTVYACLVLGLWCALVGGIFKAFSEFIMTALRNTTSGAEAMREINRIVVSTEFVFALIALGPLSLAFAIYAWRELDGAAAVLIVAAALIYIPAVLLMTVFGNVPMNDRLAKLAPASDEAARYWSVYGVVWTRLNHVRTAGSIATALAYFGALLLLANPA